MVEVFKTNVRNLVQAKALVKKLGEYYPESNVNVDIYDCDHVLRVEGRNICPLKIIELVTDNGYYCEELI